MRINITFPLAVAKNISVIQFSENKSSSCTILCCLHKDFVVFTAYPEIQQYTQMRVLLISVCSKPQGILLN